MSNLTAVVTKFGAPLELKEAAIPTPGKDEVVVKMKLFPVNPADIASINGVYPGWQPASLPAVPGLEGVGVVHAIGEGVDNLKVGDRVSPIFVDIPRAFQQYLVVKKNWAVKIPEKISDEVASQLIVNPITVWGLLDQAGLQKGQFVLQSAAGSEVGRMVIQVAKLKGIKTVNLVRRKEQVEELKQLGGDIVLCTSDEGDLAEAIKKETGGGVHAAFDCVQGALTGKMFSALLPGGRLIIYGAMDGISFTAPGVEALFKGTKIEGFWVTSLLRELLAKNDPKLEQIFKDVFSWIETEPTFGGHVGERFELKQINEAIAASQKPAKPGKVVVSAN